TRMRLLICAASVKQPLTWPAARLVDRRQRAAPNISRTSACAVDDPASRLALLTPAVLPFIPVGDDFERLVRMRSPNSLQGRSNGPTAAWLNLEVTAPALRTRSHR